MAFSTLLSELDGLVQLGVSLEPTPKADLRCAVAYLAAAGRLARRLPARTYTSIGLFSLPYDGACRVEHARQGQGMKDAGNLGCDVRSLLWMCDHYSLLPGGVGTGSLPADASRRGACRSAVPPPSTHPGRPLAR